MRSNSTPRDIEIELMMHKLTLNRYHYHSIIFAKRQFQTDQRRKNRIYTIKKLFKNEC